MVAALNAVQPHDWGSFLHGWLDDVGDEVPLLSGIERSGWRLVYTDTPSRFQNAVENVGEEELSPMGVDEMFSVGLFLKSDGRVADVLWQGPAFKAGLAPGMTLVAINGQPYSKELLRRAIKQAQQDKKPLQIRAQGDGVTQLYTVHYDGELKYPHLARIPGTPDVLDQILAPRAENGTQAHH